MQSCYLAGPGVVEQVNILREGTDGAEMKVVPRNPVVVELVKERYSFVASRDALYDDREEANIEAERLRLEDIERKQNRRKEIARMINSMDSDSSTEVVQEPKLVLVSAPEEVVEIEVDDSPQVIDVEPEFPEDVIEGNPASPTNFLKNIQRVIGNETLSLEEVHLRLKKSGLMPASDNPIHYIKFQMSGHRSLFERPTRSSVCLTAESPYLGRTWNPESVPIKKRGKASKKPFPLSTVKNKPVVVEKPVKKVPLKINPIFLNWLGNPMVQTTANEASCSNDSMKLLEQKKGKNWTCEILLVEMGKSYHGTSPRRDFARNKASGAMQLAVRKLNIIVYGIINPKKQDE